MAQPGGVPGPSFSWRSVGLFALLGPIVGLALLLVYFAVSTIVQQGISGVESVGLVTGLLLFGLLGFVFAPVIGIVPAAATGLFAAMLKQRGMNGPAYYGLCALAGAVTSEGPVLLVVRTLDADSVVLALVGGGSALVCALLTGPSRTAAAGRTGSA